MPKIIHKRDKCLGCGSCVVSCSQYWEIAADGKATLKNSQRNKKNGNFEVEIKEVGCNQEAADVCPVQCIIIEK